jgi:hypothetical protein
MRIPIDSIVLPAGRRDNPTKVPRFGFLKVEAGGWKRDFFNPR